MFLDKEDNIESKTTEHGNYQYGYDDFYRLTNTDNPNFDDETFTYDGVGNRLTSEDTTGDWSYNDNNELSGYDDVSYEYDPNGNMTKKTVGGAVTSYVYNVEDRLSEVWSGEVSTGSLTASYYYDPFGRRLWKDVGGVRTYFHYADEGLIGEFDSAGAEIKSYGYKPGSTWTTDPLFMKVGSSYYFYQNDHLGTPQKMTSVNGAVVWSAKYSSFGKATVEVETVENNLRFPGQYWDDESGLRYNWFRYYDAEVGRYLRKDPIGFGGDDENLYNYIWSNPTKWLDSHGLMGRRPREIDSNRSVNDSRMRMRSIMIMRDPAIQRAIRRLRSRARLNPGGSDFEHTACCYTCESGRTVCRLGRASISSNNTTGPEYELESEDVINDQGERCCRKVCMHVHENETDDVRPSGRDYMPPGSITQGPPRPFMTIGMGNTVVIMDTISNQTETYYFETNDRGRSYRLTN